MDAARATRCAAGSPTPMREDCSNLTEATVAGGHELTLERPAEVNAEMAAWIDANRLSS